MVSRKLAPQDVLNQSGHSFHSRVVKRLRDLGWSVTVSPYYSDNFTDRPREIDLIAEMAFPVRHTVLGIDGDIVVRLFIECKYIPSTTVFWFDAKDMDQAIRRVSTDIGVKSPHLRNFSKRHHHLASDPVAKLFSTGQGRGDDNEAMAKAINQILHALIYYRHRNVVDREHMGEVLASPYFPVIVVNSFEHLHGTKMSDSSATIPVLEPFQLEVNYAYKDEAHARNEYFLIDVVSLEKLQAFLESIRKDDVEAVVGSLTLIHRG
jgi:hypothetical protein